MIAADKSLLSGPRCKTLLYWDSILTRCPCKVCSTAAGAEPRLPEEVSQFGTEAFQAFFIPERLVCKVKAKKPSRGNANVWAGGRVSYLLVDMRRFSVACILQRQLGGHWVEHLPPPRPNSPLEIHLIQIFIWIWTSNKDPESFYEKLRKCAKKKVEKTMWILPFYLVIHE